MKILTVFLVISCNPLFAQESISDLIKKLKSTDVDEYSRSETKIISLAEKLNKDDLKLLEDASEDTDPEAGKRATRALNLVKLIKGGNLQLYDLDHQLEKAKTEKNQEKEKGLTGQISDIEELFKESINKHFKDDAQYVVSDRFKEKNWSKHLSKDNIYFSLQEYKIIEMPVIRPGDVQRKILVPSSALAVINIKSQDKIEVIKRDESLSKIINKVSNEEEALQTVILLCTNFRMACGHTLSADKEKFKASKEKDGITVETKPKDGGDVIRPIGPGGNPAIDVKVVFDKDGKLTTFKVVCQMMHVAPICIGAYGLIDSKPTFKIYTIDTDSIAEKGGLKIGDIIIKFNGSDLPERNTLQSMRKTIFEIPVGSKLTVTILREGKESELILTKDKPSDPTKYVNW